MTKVRMRYPTTTGAWVPFLVGIDSNIYAKYGIDLDIQMLAPDQQIPNVISGGADVAGTSAENVVSAVLGGAPIIMIAAMVPKAVGYMMVRPEIAKIEDLKGATLVVTGFGNVAEFAYRRILPKYGLDPSKDVTIQPVQTTPAEIAAVAAGQAKAFMAYPPDDVTAKRALPGIHSLYDVSQDNIPYVQASILTSKSFLSSNREALINFVKGTAESIVRVKKDRQLAADTYKKYNKSNDDEAAQSGTTFYSDVAPVIPAVPLEAIQNTIQTVGYRDPRANSADPKTILDTSITDQLTKEGFASTLGA